MTVRRVPAGKVPLYIYLTKAVYKSVRLEAMQQGASVSKLIEACIILQAPAYPLIGKKLEKAGKPRKVPRATFVPINAHAYPQETETPENPVEEPEANEPEE